MSTRRSVETLFCTASDTMAESDDCLDETRLSATDVMLAKLTLSPFHTSTQLSVSADPPIKHGMKANGRTKKAFCVQQADKPTTWCSATCVSCGCITHAWENGQKRLLACGAAIHADNCRYSCATGEHYINARGDIDVAKRQQC